MRWRREDGATRRHGAARPEACESGAELAHPEDVRCNCAASGQPLLQELASDHHEALAVSLLRFVFAGYCSGKVAAWDQGFEAAANVLGQEGGAVFFSRVLTLGRAVRAERLGTFNFMPGHCSCVSEDEIELVRLVQSGRSADPRLLDQALLMFAHHLETERLRASILALVALLGVITDEPPGTAAAHATSRQAGTRLH
jgi:hypothetical protein